MDWQDSGSPRPKYSECPTPLEKFSPAPIFSSVEDIVLIDYFPKGRTINAEYYSSMMDK
jgi:hypothetical protein